MARFIEYKVEGEDVIRAKFAAYEERQRVRLRELLSNFADLGAALLRRNVPVFHGSLYRHVDSRDATWRPGGVGGGGEYESIFGVKGPSILPYYAEFGTGIYGKRRLPITPQRGPYMTFYSTLYRKVIHVRRARGQRAQRFFYITWREFQVYAAARLLTYHPFE